MATIKMNIDDLIHEHIKLLKLLNAIKLLFDDLLDANISHSQRKQIKQVIKKVIQEYREQNSELHEYLNM